MLNNKTVGLILVIMMSFVACDSKSVQENIEVKEKIQKNTASVIDNSNHDDVIKVCYCPWGVLGDDSLPGKGAASYIVAKVLENAGYKVQVDIINWSRCVDLAKKRDYDLIAALYESKALSKEFNFLNNSVIDKVYFYTNINTGINSGDMNSLKGKSIAIVRDAGGTEALFSRQDEFKIYKVANQKQAVNMILEGRADLTFHVDKQFEELLKNDYSDKVSQIKKLYPSIQANYGTPAMSKNHPRYKEILEKYNKSYRELVKNGLYDELESVFKTKFESRPLSHDGNIN